MERLDSAIKIVSAVAGAVISFFFGGWNVLLTILLSSVAIDYITGVIAAGMEGKLNSTIGLKGIAKKVAIFFVVAVAHMLDIALGNDMHVLRNATIFFYIANEVLSIFENVGRIGIPIPGVLEKAIHVLNEKSEKGEGK